MGNPAVILGIPAFLFICFLFARPSAEEQKKQKEQIDHRREVALARMIDLLNQKLSFHNQQAIWRLSLIKNQVEVERSEIAGLIPEFINDPKLRERVWRKGFSFKRLSGSRILFIKSDPPSDSEKYVDSFF